MMQADLGLTHRHGWWFYSALFVVTAVLGVFGHVLFDTNELIGPIVRALAFVLGLAASRLVFGRFLNGVQLALYLATAYGAGLLLYYLYLEWSLDGFILAKIDDEIAVANGSLTLHGFFYFWSKTHLSAGIFLFVTLSAFSFWGCLRIPRAK